MSNLSFLYSQLFVEPSVPNHDFKNQTIIVTGGGRGIGFEAARHLLRLNAACVILAVRSLERGRKAAEELETSTDRVGAITVHELDMESCASVKKFVAEMRAVGRIDAILLNAGIYSQVFELVEGHERSVTVNVINTFLLATLMVPVLKESAKRWSISPRITVVASDRHVMVDLPESREGNTFEILNDEMRTNMNERYYTSKLLQILLARALSDVLRKQGANGDKDAGRIVVNSLTPGYCLSGLVSDAKGIHGILFKVMAKTLARTTEVGGRILVSALAMGEESHGQYINDGEIQDSALSPFVRSSEGLKAQSKVWGELIDILQKIDLGTRDIVRI